ncbi:MAG: reverse transcriptase domain-containing protein [candidate division NC10 bacterium]
MGAGKIDIIGHINVVWRVGGRERVVDTLVAKGLPFQAVMGLTCLKRLHAGVFPHRNYMVLEGLKKGVPLTTVGSRRHGVNCVYLEKDVVVPPLTAGYIMDGKCRMHAPTGQFLLVEPVFLAEDGATGERALVNKPAGPRNGLQDIRVAVANTTEEPLILRSGTEVAQVEGVYFEDVTSAPDLVEHLVKLYNDEQEAESGLPVGLDLETDTILTVEQMARLKVWVKSKTHLFIGKGVLPSKARVPPHRIDTGDSHPVRARYGRKAQAEHDVIEEEVHKLLGADMIVPSDSEWCAPVVLITRKDGKPRFCIDYRRLNDVTRKDGYPIPRIDDALDLMGASPFLSSLDFATGYYQVPMSQKDRKKTAFSTRSGHYQWEVMPMGLCNAPATFQRVMNVLLSGLTWNVCLCYIDDIIIFSRTFEEHMVTLEQIFVRIERANLKLRANKCFFCRKELLYLGHVLTQTGVHTNPLLIADVKECQPPVNRKEARHFLGLAGYYRRFVHKFSSLALPIQRLLREDVPWDWDEDCQEAFDDLKNRLTSAPILKYPDFEARFKLEIDGSGVGLGAVLSQKGADGLDHVIGYWSRGIPRRKGPYIATELECMALHHAIKHFRPYLWGRQFEAVTDHNALKWLMNLKNPTPKLQKWGLDLAEYDFTITHRAGTANANADALSRPPIVRVNAFGHFLAKVGPADMARLQRRDPEIGLYYEYIRDQRLPLDRGDIAKVLSQAPRLSLEEGVLVRDYEPTTPGVAKTVWRQLVVPRALRVQIIRDCHDEYLGGHLGETKTYLRVKQRFWWPRMSAEIRTWVRTCQSCQSGKSPRRKLQGLLIPTLTSYPWEKVAIDILGPLPESDRGHRYVVVLTDAFSKWAEVAPLVTQSMANVADVLIEQVVCRFGCPSKLLSDRGGNFLSGLAVQINEVLRIKKLSTTSYHPQTDAITERFNSTLVGMLKHYVNAGHTDWDEFLQYVTFAYNTAVHATTRYSPFFLIFGREAVLPVDVAMGTVRERGQAHYPYVRQMLKDFREAYRMVRRNLELAAQGMARRYDLTRRESSVKPGDRVWRSVPYVPPGYSRKLYHKWRGPYRVLERRGNNTCRLREISSGRVHRTRVHVEKLKPYFEREDPNDDPEPFIPWDERAQPAAGHEAPEEDLPEEEVAPEEEDEGPYEDEVPLERAPAAEQQETPDDDVPGPAPDEAPAAADKAPQWAVARLLKPLLHDGVKSYQVKWTGFPDPTIEPRARLLEDVPKTVKRYEKAHRVKFEEWGVTYED